MLLIASLLASTGCSSTEVEPGTVAADVWVDNWFALYVGDELIKEDSVAFNTEQSFNAESFSFQATLPLQLNLIIRDYLEDDTGLEYIGSRRQQMGDGGFIAQFFDAQTNDLIAVSDDSWRCLPVHRAPLNRQCERSPDPAQSCESEIIDEPQNWKSPDFDDSHWPNATIHTEQAVRPRRGYLEIDWHPSAKLIWGADLEIDNTLLCRISISAPE